MYCCELVKVVDGDTLVLNINLGVPVDLPDGKLLMNLWVKGKCLWLIKERVRLVRINAPEIKTELGPVAKEHMVKLSQLCPLQVAILGRDKYGRVLGDVFTCGGDSISTLMVVALMAKDY